MISITTSLVVKFIGDGVDDVMKSWGYLAAWGMCACAFIYQKTIFESSLIRWTTIDSMPCSEICDEVWSSDD